MSKDVYILSTCVCMYHTYAHMMEHYSVIKRDQLLKFVLTWINPENIMQRKNSVTKSTYYMISFI